MNVYGCLVMSVDGSFMLAMGAAWRRPALFATRTKPVVLARRVTIGSVENERDLFKGALFSAALLDGAAFLF